MSNLERRPSVIHRSPTASLLVTIACFTACGSRQPPPDFAPDPLLVDRIREIRMRPGTDFVCPGQSIEMHYEAVLSDGAVLPFARQYDEDNPPPLHVVFLRRTSPDAYPERDGDWDTVDDPLATAMHGVRLRAELLARPAIEADTTLVPEYSCLPSRFSFTGSRGREGQSGGPGPAIVARVAELRSPFYDRLLVVAVEVGEAALRYTLADADRVPPADWMLLESRGGRGGDGLAGDEGSDGVAGRPGCPGGPGGAGGAGGPGGPGAPGGQGGPITLLVTEDDRYVAGLVQPVSGGGPGGKGGPGGPGGAGGAGGRGTLVDGQRCADGTAGADGQDGANGPDGPAGGAGPAPRVLTVEASDIFPRYIPQPLQDLIDYSREN